MPKLIGAACQCIRGGRCQSAVETGERAICGDALRVIGAKGGREDRKMGGCNIGRNDEPWQGDR